MRENELAKIVVDCAFTVHTTLGPGLLETVYQAALAHELRRRGLKVITERGIPVEYDGIRLRRWFQG